MLLELFRSLGGHRLRNKATGLEKDEERASAFTLRGGRSMGERGGRQERPKRRGVLAVL